MLTLLIWAAGVLLESVILFRGLRAKLLRKYPLFYTYIFCVLIVELSGSAAYRMGPSVYRNWYWATQFLTLLVGYGIILEIVHKSLASYEGAARIATVLLSGVFAVVFSYVIYEAATTPHWSPAATYFELERDLRTVQAVVLAAILAVIFRYSVPIGRNVRGIIFGYGLYLGTSIINLELRSYAGPSFHQAWSIILTVSYLLSLMVWTRTLWSFSPNPALEHKLGLRSDYEALATSTKDLLGQMRSHLGRTARQ